MIHFDDLTDEEQAFRALLDEHVFESKTTIYARWARAVRAQWEKTPAGKAAVAARVRDVGGFRN